MTEQGPAAEAFGPRSARRERDMRRWQQRSQFIAVLRFGLPGAIAGIFLLLAAWLAFGGAVGRFGEHPGPGPGTIHMTDARFLGRDAQGRSYVLTAQQAARDNVDVQRITLTQPSLVLDADNPSPTRLSADRGVYREDNRILLLDGHVTLTDGQGDSFITSQAIVDTVKGAVAGKSPITGRGPTGTIRAESYAVFDRGERLVFQGGVHSRLNAH